MQLSKKRLKIYDPAMCCSTGTCGSEPDQELIRFAADLSWLSDHGVAVERFNLAQQPDAFLADSAIRALLESDGVQGLPVVIADDQILATSRYPGRAELAEALGFDIGAQ